MNGVGPDTVIKDTDIALHRNFKVAATIFVLLFAASLVLWIVKKQKFKKTEAYTSYKAYRAEMKNK